MNSFYLFIKTILYRFQEYETLMSYKQCNWCRATLKPLFIQVINVQKHLIIPNKLFRLLNRQLKTWIRFF